MTVEAAARICPSCQGTFSAKIGNRLYEFLLLANDGTGLRATRYLLCDACSAVVLGDECTAQRTITAAIAYIQAVHEKPSHATH